MWEDSPESELITPEDEARLFATSLDGLVLAEENGQTVIKGGKLGKLVERLTLIAMPDWDYISAFVMTHHSFTTSFDLLEALINRYETALPPGLTESTFDQFIKKAIVPVRLRVCTVIRMWIEMHFEEDLAVSDSLVMRLQDFIDKRSGVDLSTMSSRITMPRVLLPRHHDLAQYLMTEPRGFMEIDPQELARQLSIMEFSFFQRVKVWECLDQIWGDRRKKEARAYGTKVPEDVAESSGGISSMIKHTNKLTNWIAQVVITADTIKGRINCIKYFVMLAAQCREIRNFNAITAISAGLSQASVGRLKKTWSAFAESHGRTYELYKEISALVSPRGQYAEYRKTLKEMTPPAIPFLGVYLTDLTFIELGNTDFLPDGGYINFEKRRKVAHIIRSIQSYQLHPYHFMPVIAIQEFIHGLHATMSEDEMYEKSLQVEPREDDISDDE
ncbi:hypothetical protein CXG81DRAFT_10590 [Caulochytrium protostelioides]|uniref:Ras GEF n=1 Tax=Caulochytrium protostelioides TaxID=1555241 RepID=A0A4P9XB62_9FUNG|nr:hypothetical protein CXG81DRAFT_10590 [Caulochytrium protostelioides]|eukprot:RKP02606.1 hypothetical protein CXG81DRAFT_10590 [Caulochytrium protostelioides]